MAVELESAPAAPAAAPAPNAPAIRTVALPNAPKVEIKVSEMTPTAAPAAAPKRGSAKAAMFENLRSRAGQEPGTDRAAAPAAERATPTVADVDASDLEDGPPETVELEEEVTDPKAVVPAADAKKPKANPWKLVEEFKKKLAEAEQSRLEIEKRAIPEDKWKAREEELAAKNKRLEEIEEEIRYTNYSKSEEFRVKYQEPYEKAWSDALNELGELTVIENGEERAINAKDILELVNMPLKKAGEIAEEKFGDLMAGRVLDQRDKIKDLFKKQNDALDKARKDGSERELRMKAESQKAFGEMADSIRSTWSKANEAVVADPKVGKFFQPVEGDAEINQRLAKGFELADRAFSENPADPKLTPEQRESIVKRHAAVRNRAAAFGRIVYENNKHITRIAELEKALAEYKGGEPEIKGKTTPAAPPAQGKGMSGVIGQLRKIAKQV